MKISLITCSSSRALFTLPSEHTGNTWVTESQRCAGPISEGYDNWYSWTPRSPDVTSCWLLSEGLREGSHIYVTNTKNSCAGIEDRWSSGIVYKCGAVSDMCKWRIVQKARCSCRVTVKLKENVQSSISAGYTNNKYRLYFLRHVKVITSFWISLYVTLCNARHLNCFTFYPPYIQYICYVR
jgi:hypothetical protein